MTYDNRQELVKEICERLAQGEPLAKICRDEHMPGVTTVWEWEKADKSVSEGIARAREAGHDWIAADCLEIADKPEMGEKVTTKEWGTEVSKGDMTDHRKLRIWTRLQLLAKWDPKRYGDKQQIEHSGRIDTATVLRAARKRSGRSA